MQRILVCLDTDPQPSVFDSVVAVDAGADRLFRHGAVTPEQVEGLVHGALFTRGPADLKHTALFIGGSDVAAAEALFERATACFFGPMRVSVLLDPNGSNTTAAAAVIAAGRHAELGGDTSAAIIGTGPVGQRAALLLAREGVRVRVVSRSRSRAAEICGRLAGSADSALLIPTELKPGNAANDLGDSQILIAAGPAGVEVLSAADRNACPALRVVVDLNAVPPAGVGGVGVTDKAVEHGGQHFYGAIGVGGAKMKIHKAALRRLFESNDALLDAAEVYRLGVGLER